MSSTKKIYLSDLKEGDEARILGFANEEIPTKFYEIGIVPGIEISIYKKAPFSGPICFIIGTDESKLALGKKEAGSVLVEMLR